MHPLRAAGVVIGQHDLLWCVVGSYLASRRLSREEVNKQGFSLGAIRLVNHTLFDAMNTVRVPIT